MHAKGHMTNRRLWAQRPASQPLARFRSRNTPGRRHFSVPRQPEASGGGPIYCHLFRSTRQPAGRPGPSMRRLRLEHTHSVLKALCPRPASWWRRTGQPARLGSAWPRVQANKLVALNKQATDLNASSLIAQVHRARVKTSICPFASQEQSALVSLSFFLLLLLFFI